MVLIGDVEELTRDTLLLQGGEGGKALPVRHPVVPPPLDHEHGRRPVLDMIDRVMAVVAVRVGLRGAVELPLREPEFLGAVIERMEVEEPGVADEATEPLGPVPGDPVDHVPAVGCAEGRDIAPVHPGMRCESRIEPHLQIRERFSSPIVPDGVRERLAVADRPVEVDHDHGIPPARIGLGVVAVVEPVSKPVLGPSVDQQCDRIAFR